MGTEEGIAHGLGRPRIAITLGDPGGVGAEVVIKALMRPVVQDALDAVVLGDMGVLQSCGEMMGVSLKFRRRGEEAFASREDGIAGALVIVLEALEARGPGQYVSGAVAAANGRAAHGWVVDAVRLALDGVVDGICTAPISKEAMFAAGFSFPGHTELLAELCGGADVRMMLVGGGLHVVLQTIHVAIAEVPTLVTAEAVGESLRIMDAWARVHRGPGHRRIAVCGLNPHAGEGGHFGREELDVLHPAVNEARGRGCDVSGPYPADTVFHRVREGEFDLVLAMYHDQGLIPVKTLDFHGGVNVTLGLPIVRTSPDHGTAFGIAGQGVANESSMVAALLKAAELARVRRDPAAME